MERKDNELRASGNEGESPEPVIARDDSAGTSSAPAGRYYECIFCRRGFSTAQALGGHMNIHRRDRPRIRPAAVPPLMRREEGYHPYSREQWYSPTPAVENYVVYFPESPSSMDSQSPRQRPGAEKEWKGEENEVEDMDLELRLGHRRRHQKP